MNAARKLTAWMGALAPPLQWNELAERLEIHKSLMSRLVSGERKPTCEVVAKVERMTFGRVTSIDWMPPGWEAEQRAMEKQSDAKRAAEIRECLDRLASPVEPESP